MRWGVKKRHVLKDVTDGHLDQPHADSSTPGFSRYLIFSAGLLLPCTEGRALGFFFAVLQGATLDTAPDFAPIYPQIRTPQVICSLSKCFDGFVLSQNQSARRPDVNVSILGWIVMFDGGHDWASFALRENCLYDSHLPKYQS